MPASPGPGCLQLQQAAATACGWALSSHPIEWRLVAHRTVFPRVLSFGIGWVCRPRVFRSDRFRRERTRPFSTSCAAPRRPPAGRLQAGTFATRQRERANRSVMPSLPARVPARKTQEPSPSLIGTLAVMDEVTFHVERAYVVPVVNGTDLRESIGRPGLIGFSPMLLPPSGELFGESEAPGAGPGQGAFAEPVPILTCGCREAGCGSVTVRISTAQDEVVWDEFSDYAPETGAVALPLGQFRFSRAEYGEAAGAAARTWRSDYQSKTGPRHGG